MKIIMLHNYSWFLMQNCWWFLLNLESWKNLFWRWSLLGPCDWSFALSKSIFRRLLPITIIKRNMCLLDFLTILIVVVSQELLCKWFFIFIGLYLISRYFKCPHSVFKCKHISACWFHTEVGGHLSTHLYMETPLVEMDEKKFFKWFPKFGTKSYQKYLNCMEILWVNKHSLRRTYILQRSPFTENDISFWLQKLLL